MVREIHLRWENGEQIPYNVYDYLRYEFTNVVPFDDDYTSPILMQSATNNPYDKVASNVLKRFNYFIARDDYKKLYVLHDIVKKDKILKHQNLIDVHALSICNEFYNHNVSILELSKKYKCSPTNIVKLTHAPTNYDRFMSLLYSQKIIIPKREYKEIMLAENNDLNSYIMRKKDAKLAIDAEQRFISFMRKDIRFYTENEIKKYSRLTPDILFIDKVYINNERIYWIDFKNYIGTDTSFLYKSNIKQAKKYNERFGKGAFCYQYGIVENLHIDNTMLLCMT